MTQLSFSKILSLFLQNIELLWKKLSGKEFEQSALWFQKREQVKHEPGVCSDRKQAKWQKRILKTHRTGERQKQKDKDTERERGKETETEIPMWFIQRIKRKRNQTCYPVTVLHFTMPSVKVMRNILSASQELDIFILFLQPMVSFCSEQTTELFEDN